MHDDIEDDDWFRYGRPALHRRYGLAAAINVGDYLIGLGYRLVAAQRDALGAEATADILAQFAQAHTRLCEGQGAELAWRDAPRPGSSTPLDALKIYALKTAPAFEAAILAGVRLAGPVEPLPRGRSAASPATSASPTRSSTTWTTGSRSSRSAAARRRRPAGRPAHGALGPGLGGAGRRRSGPSWIACWTSRPPTRLPLARARELYEQAGVFRQAAALVPKHHRPRRRGRRRDRRRAARVTSSISWPTPSSTAAPLDRSSEDGGDN